MLLRLQEARAFRTYVLGERSLRILLLIYRGDIKQSVDTILYIFCTILLPPFLWGSLMVETRKLPREECMQAKDESDMRDGAMENTRAQLAAKLLRMVSEPGRCATTIEGLLLTRWDTPNQTDACFYAPAIGVIVQGHKQSLLGSETFSYGALDCLVNGVDMPSASRILAASPDKPLLAVSLVIDRQLATELAAEIPSGSAAPSGHYLGVSIARVTADVLDAFSRLVDLLDKPEQIPLLAPLLVREIISRVLMGPQGGALRMMYTSGSHSNQVAEAITWLRSHYMQPLRVEALAGRVNMATSSFHRQFKKVTSLSPLQFQKCLRLYEVQRLMLTEDMDAYTAAHAVGYDNVQQCNREYKRLFGDPPHRNIKKIRQE